MTLSRRKFSAEFKLRAVRQVEAGASVAAVARRHEIHPTLLSKWRQQLRRDPERAFQRDREPNDEQVQVSELEQLVGRLTMENALLKKALARLEMVYLCSALDTPRLPWMVPRSRSRSSRSYWAGTFLARA